MEVLIGQLFGAFRFTKSLLVNLHESLAVCRFSCYPQIHRTTSSFFSYCHSHCSVRLWRKFCIFKWMQRMKSMIQTPVKSIVFLYLGRQSAINSGHAWKTDVKVKWELVLSGIGILPLLHLVSMSSLAQFSSTCMISYFTLVYHSGVTIPHVFLVMTRSWTITPHVGQMWITVTYSHTKPVLLT